MRNILIRTTLIGIALLLNAGLGLAAEPVRIHGSATVAKGIVEPKLAEIQGGSGETLAVVANGSANGLQDLAAGRADIAMISAPLEVEAAIVNGRTPGALDVSGFTVYPVGSSEVFLVLHPSNPVKTLTEAQARDVFSGKIGNWSQLGGPDRPIAVVVEQPGNGTRAVVESQLTKTAPIAGDARVVTNLKDVTDTVGKEPGAIGYGNAASIDRTAVTVVDGVVLRQPLALVTKGEPTAGMAKVISAVAAAGAKR